MRVLINTPATITQSWFQGDTIADPGSVTVTVTRDDGTTLTTGSATGTGAAPRSFNLAAVTQLDNLTVTWVSATLGTLTSTVEVVGGFLFAISDLRALVGSTPTNDQLTAMRLRVTQAIEGLCGVAFVPRYDRRRVGGLMVDSRMSIIDGESQSRNTFRLRPYLRKIRWATLDGVAVDAQTITDARVDDYGFASMAVSASLWHTLIVGFEHGLDTPPEPVKAAALDYARFLLTQDASIDSRAERLITDDGTLVFGGTGLGVPSVDRIVDQYRIPQVA